jgi:SAM-dependent methyltransferase
MSGSSGTVGASPEPGTTLTRDTPELAATYEEVSIRQFENGKQLVSALNISSGERVLDIGAGTGRLAAYVAKIVGPSGCVVGIDPLPLRIKIAQSKAIGKAHSTAKCNGEIFGVEENLTRSSVAEYLSGTRVEFVLDPLDLGIRHNREIGTFWEVLSE